MGWHACEPPATRWQKKSKRWFSLSFRSRARFYCTIQRTTPSDSLSLTEHLRSTICSCIVSTFCSAFRWTSRTLSVPALPALVLLLGFLIETWQNGNRFLECLGDIYPFDKSGDMLAFFVSYDRKQFNSFSSDVFLNNITVFGFGGNVVTILLMAVLGMSKTNTLGNRRMTSLEKVVLQYLPILGAFLSLWDVIILLRSMQSGEAMIYHLWFFRCSRFAVWVIVILLSRSSRSSFVFFDRILCFWWILKPILVIPLLLTSFTLSGVLVCLKESCIVLVDVLFGISINIIRSKRASFKTGSIEESLLPPDGDESFLRDPGDADSFWNQMVFKSIDFVMNRGVLKQLDFEDLLPLPTDMNPSSCHEKLQSCWEAQWNQNDSDPSLFRSLFHAYGWAYLSLGLLKVINDCIGFAGPLLLNRLIRFLERGSGHLEGYVLAVSLGGTSIVKSFLDTQYSFRVAKLKLKLRSSIMTVIYQKCLRVGLAERSRFSVGEIQTFMSVDADRTVNLCNSFHDMWSLPLQIGVALYLLYTQVKFAFVAGVAITVLLIPVNKWISELIASATQKMMKQKDERIRRTGELLAHIRTLKMYGWELLFSDWLMETRSSEVKHLSTRKYLDAWCVFFWATTPTLFSLCTFGLFTLMGHQLDAATVFTCLALFNTLISPLNSFPWVINGLIDAFISIRRLSRFLSCSEHQYQQWKLVDSPYSSGNVAVVMEDACCDWSSSKSEELNIIINHITLTLPKGLLVAIIGEVGSGKSSLLNSILGEMRLLHGSIRSARSVAYVPQAPWILSGTVRDNILFGNNYDSKRYCDTLQACALDVDVSVMAGGDMAHIGEKGVNLSGGQRARIGLARALYHSADILMLDDVLSAVDAQVAQWILNNAILGPLMDQKTCLLCTHNVQAISRADMVVVMEKGGVMWVGQPAELAISEYSAFLTLTWSNALLQCPVQESCMSSSEVREETELLSALEIAQEIIEEELRKEGRVELIVYKKYAAFAGSLIAFVILLSAVSMQASRNGSDLWLSYWVDTTKGSSETASSTTFYLVILCLFCVMNSFLTLVRAFLFAYGGLRAAVKVHATLLCKIVNAPVKFFNQTPSGRILNRFSSDLYTIDDSLPFILNILLANFVGLLGIAVVLSYVQVLFLFLLLPFWFIYSRLQFFYRSTSRELRRLDSVTRSPIYSSFTETLDGSSTIRAFNSQDFFWAKFIEHVALYQRTSLSELIASLWLSLRLQLLAAFIISFVAITSVIGSRGNLPVSFGTPGLVGLALSYAAPIVSLLGSFLTSFTETEKEMVAVERALQYVDIPEEELGGCQLANLDWPSQGLIEFQNVTLRYGPTLPPALRNLTFTIPGGMQVGVVGRTGAGKSSILNALFRLNPICSGCILVDGLNINNVPVRDLRSSFAVVPQSPFLFEGSLRDNLDPFRMTDDIKIWDVLEKCHLKDEVEAAGGLDLHIKESGMSFSVGQRQLLCLARALLKSSKVLCLDECTASIDTRTASLLQKTLSSGCKGTTVITIAHRISTVQDMDCILVLDHGVLVEQGDPKDLLEDEFSRFSSFAKASTM
ncbi:ABC transporter C family member 13 isoform X2 [Punica granatum]|uniref:ABC-type xenobiotic transporter n=2 Tax=Punica granatum TaxID=22663 RepID=A0A6P8DDU0_PUNGR|nr:ABC transporter C family member 13 isoform X2 [Punica granatum]